MTSVTADLSGVSFGVSFFFFKCPCRGPPFKEGGFSVCPRGFLGLKAGSKWQDLGAGCGWGHGPGGDPFSGAHPQPFPGAPSKTVPETEKPHWPPQQTQEKRQLLQAQAALGQPRDRGLLPGGSHREPPPLPCPRGRAR